MGPCAAGPFFKWIDSKKLQRPFIVCPGAMLSGMDLERRVFSPNNDEGRAEAAVPPHEMDEATLKLYNTIQNMLALIAYVEHNKLAISP